MKLIILFSVLVLSGCGHAVLVTDCKPHHIKLDGKLVSECQAE